MGLLPNLPSVLSDLFAGIAAAGIFGGWALLTRTLGGKLSARLVARLRRLGWPLVASVFFGVSLVSAALRGGTVSVIMLAALLTVTASMMTLRFGPERLRLSAPRPVQPVVEFCRAYPWRILFSVFFVTTIALLTLNLTSSSSSSAPGERITFVVNLADEEMLVFRDILDELEPKLGADIFLVNVDSSRYVPRLDNMVGRDNMKWDLIAADNNMLGVLAAKGLVQELPPDGESTELVPDSLMMSLRPLMTFEGTRYFAPFRPNVKIAYYNEQKFAQYGLEPPRTWDQLLEVAKILKEKEGTGRVAIQGYPGAATAVTVFEFVRAAGGDPFTLGDDESREAFEFLQALEPYLAPEYAETRFDTANELLMDDQVYLVSNWTFGIKVVVEDGGKGEIKAYPGWDGPNGQVHVLGGDVLAVPKGAPHTDKAIKLIELLLSRETQQQLLSRLRWMPVRLDAYDSAPPALAPYFEAVKDAMSYAEARPTKPQWILAENILDRAFGALIRDGNDIGTLEDFSTAMLEMPADYLRYEVRAGDTLDTVAARHGTTPDILAAANHITTRTSIRPKQVLLVPSK